MPSDTPPPPDLPLNALRAFEAAARLGGFRAAARELGVTSGAITGHVKGLEERLGARLFDRHPRGVTLTPLGASVLPGLTGAFDMLGTAVHLLRAGASPLRLGIATHPAIARDWLRPRLAAMQAAMPGLAVTIVTLDRPPMTRRAPHDLWLFYDPAGPADWLVPVRAPDGPDGPRLSDPGFDDDWAVWTADSGTRPDGPDPVLHDDALGEARRAAGVAMGRGSLIGADLACGRLVEAGPRCPAPEGLHVTVAHPGRVARAAAAWLRDEIEAHTSAV